VIIPAQRAALIVVKALGNALHVEAMPAPVRLPPAAAIRLHANRAGGSAFLPADASLLQADGFLHESDKAFQVEKKCAVHLSLRCAKCDSDEPLHPAHQKLGMIAVRLVRTNHVNSRFVDGLVQACSVFHIAKCTPQVAEEPLHLCTQLHVAIQGNV
jgi:hypothetical protein